MSFLSTTIILIIGLVLTAFLTLIERQVLGLGQLRVGPRKVGPNGLLQPIADAIKLIMKFFPTPYKASIMYIIAPCMALWLAVVGWCVIPSGGHVLDFSYGVLTILILSRLTVYPLLIGGWFSGSKWASLGSIRAIAQTISYEVSITFVVLRVVVYSSTLSFDKLWYINNIKLISVLIINLGLWIITLLAETNRAPFDLPEGERELVSGFNTEYGSSGFALIFIAEYLSIVLLSYVTILLFMGSSRARLLLVMLLFFLVVRLSLPRARVDWLIKLRWVHVLPLRIVLLLLGCVGSI